LRGWAGEHFKSPDSVALASLQGPQRPCGQVCEFTSPGKHGQQSLGMTAGAPAQPPMQH